jgi:hypothetical protein
MKTYRGDQQTMENIHQTILSEAISCPGGMINVDGSDFLKSSIATGFTQQKTSFRNN